MRFGTNIGPIFPADVGAEAMYAHIQRQARLAHDNNFEGLFVGHHYILGPATAMFEPLTILSNLTGQFPGMYVGTAIFLLPFHHPIEIAERTACLDIASGGRFLFGVGQGYRDVEFVSFGIEKKTKKRRTDEAIEAIRTLWASDAASFSGDFYRFDKISIEPKPLQRPGPPIMLGADTLASVAKVPDTADHWVVSPRHSKRFLREAVPLYRKALERRGKPFKGLPMIRELCVARDRKTAEDRIKQAFEGMYHLYHRWGQPGERYDLGFDELKQERLIVGSPEEVVQQVLSYHREFGAEFMWFRLYWPGMDLDWSLETIELFGREVIPEVKRVTPDSRLP